MKNIDHITIKVGSENIKPSTNICNLGIIFDQEINSKQQVNAIIKKSHFKQKQIRSMRTCLTRDVAKC